MTLIDVAYDPSNQDHNPQKRDWILITDGSGHPDGLGGWGAIGWRTAGKTRKTFKMKGCQNETTVARMEMTALLEGLHFISEQKGIPGHRPVVWWLSDRMDLVNDLRGVNKKRSANLDLWARFNYLDQKVEVHAFYAKRMTHREQNCR